MDLSILLYGVILFIACLTAHVLLWRVTLPRHRELALFSVFLILPLIAFSVYLILVSIGGLEGGYVPETLRAGAILLLPYALSSAYILSYPAAEAISPTLVIALYLGKAGTWVERRELEALFPEESILDPRINDLLESRLAALHGSTLRITSRGRVLVFFFRVFMRFIGMRPGRG